MSIPKVAYFPRGNRSREIETLDLQQLVKRKAQLDHNPECPHRITFYILLYIREGKGNHFVDFCHFPFRSGNFIFINKGQVHAFDLSNSPAGKVVLLTAEFVEQLQVHIKTPLFAPFYIDSGYTPVFEPTAEIRKSCENLLLEMVREANRDKNDDVILTSLFSALLQLLCRARAEFNPVANSKGHKRVNQFLMLIEKQFSHSRDAKDYANWMNITYKTLNALCKIDTQKTAKQLIDGYTVLEAKRRLALDEKSVQEIAFSMGFDDSSNFVKFFKRQANQTPREFKISSKG